MHTRHTPRTHGWPMTGSSGWRRLFSLIVSAGLSSTQTYGNQCSPAEADRLVPAALWCIQRRAPSVPFGPGPHHNPVGAKDPDASSPTMEKQSAAITTSVPAPTPSATGHTSARRAEAATQSLPAPRHQVATSTSAAAATQSLPVIPDQPQVSTPVHVDRLASLLASHPDSSFSAYVINGMRHGFDIGFVSDNLPCASAVHAANHPSALNNAEFVTSYLQSKCDVGETAGPFSAPPFKSMHVSGLGVIPKQSGKLRVIHDLSFPPALSVNDGISREDFSPTYATIDMAVSETGLASEYAGRDTSIMTVFCRLVCDRPHSYSTSSPIVLSGSCGIPAI